MDLDAQLDASFKAMEEFIDFLRIDPNLLNDLLYDDIRPDLVVENKHEKD